MQNRITKLVKGIRGKANVLVLACVLSLLFAPLMSEHTHADNGQGYTVQPGDTLLKIAARLDVAVTLTPFLCPGPSVLPIIHQGPSLWSLDLVRIAFGFGGTQVGIWLEPAPSIPVP